MYIPSRRKFLSISCRSLASIGTAGIISRFGMMNAMAQNSSNYRALVCVFLLGGNDGNNTVVPFNTPSQSYQNYAAVRQGLALPQGSLLQIPAQGGAATYGLHPRLTEIQQLYLQKKSALVINVGMLVKPITRAQYLAQSVPVPQNLFSHSDQQDQWQTSYTNSFSSTGWAGRAADAVQSMNAPSVFPPVISVVGSSLFCEGRSTHPTTVTPGVPLGLSGFGYGTQARLLGFQQLLTFDNGLALVQASNGITTRGISDANTLNGALSAAPALATQFPSTQLGQQLQQVAKIIQVRSGLGMNRQIFFCALNGFDTHSNQLATQDALLGQVSPAIAAFYAATQELGVDQQVTTFTESEFARTAQPSSGGGSDHAWGGHQIVVGGAVAGGDMYGQYPTIALNGPDDISGRGVWIPTTAVDQYGATLASWFGVSAANLPTVFPNLANFTVQNLGFLG
jgi:uncharacterized protein (DUF1501 family)